MTFVFTDIEGSTRLLNQVGAEGYAKELTEHRARIREAFARHGGVEVDTQGDAFFYAFETAPSALAGAHDAQAALSELLRGAPAVVEGGWHSGVLRLSQRNRASRGL